MLSKSRSGWSLACQSRQEPFDQLTAECRPHKAKRIQILHSFASELCVLTFLDTHQLQSVSMCFIPFLQNYDTKECWIPKPHTYFRTEMNYARNIATAESKLTADQGHTATKSWTAPVWHQGKTTLHMHTCATNSTQCIQYTSVS